MFLSLKEYKFYNSEWNEELFPLVLRETDVMLVWLGACDGTANITSVSPL